MLSKTGVGSGAYQYPASGVSSALPHAVASIPGVGAFYYDENGNMTSGAGRTITWNSFDMPMLMTQGTDSSTFYYGPDHQRVTQVRSDGVTIRYAGAMEVEVKAGTTTAKTYLPLGVGVEIDNANGTQLYYTHRDRLGSVVAISDQGGIVVESLAYDSWGKRRALTAPDTPASLDGVLDNKGFTGHEMLDKGVSLAIPDHSTLRRRAMTMASLSKGGRLTDGPVHLLIDSTGLKVYGAGQWLQEKHSVRARRTWRKLHLAVDADPGLVVAATLTENDIEDPSQVAPLLDQIATGIGSVTFDGAYDGAPTYDTVTARAGDIPVIISPHMSGVLSAAGAHRPS